MTIIINHFHPSMCQTECTIPWNVSLSMNSIHISDYKKYFPSHYFIFLSLSSATPKISIPTIWKSSRTNRDLAFRYQIFNLDECNFTLLFSARERKLQLRTLNLRISITPLLIIFLNRYKNFPSKCKKNFRTIFIVR